MNEQRYWFELAEKQTTAEAQRYCYLRCVELNEEDYDARAQLAALGPGAARAPEEIKERVIFMPTSPPKTDTVYIDEPETIRPGTILLCVILTIIAATIIGLRLQGLI
jgi:hypothetical protein